MADEKANKIVQRRKKSMDYWAPIYDEFAEVQQAAKCRTNPIYKKNKDGSDSTVVDDTRTNVCMPGISIMVRKNTARMTAQPPQLDFIGGQPGVKEKLTGWHYMQYDKTNEGETRRKTVMQGEMFGIGIEKTFQDNVVVRRKMRVPTAKASRSQVLKYKGVPDDDAEQQVAALTDQHTPDEVQNNLATIGPEFQLEQEVTKYSGPVQKPIFIGDIHFPPGCDNLDTAEWIVEDYVETPTFFEYWLSQTYTDDNGQEVPVFDQVAVDELLDEDKELPADEKTSLRERFKQLVKLDSTFQYDKEIRCSKKFLIYECHEKRDGENWICWVGNNSKYIGEMPYPVDFYGAWMYTALVPLPDLVSCIGDSTPRLGRHLHRLHNVNTGQRQDLITNFMKPFVITRVTADIPDEATDRGTFRELKVQNPNDVKMEQMQQLPQYAWENENAILRQMAMLEPTLASSDMAGTNANPQMGKTATVGVLAQRERDMLLADKIIGLNVFLKKINQKKLWLLQQTMQGSVGISGNYFNQNSLNQLGTTGQPAQPPNAGQAISLRTGQATVINMDWTEIQEDIQVEPKVGSTLSIEDEFHRMGAQTLYQAAQADPETFNKPYCAKAWADTIPNVDSNQAINPPAPPPDPMAQIKQSSNMSWDMAKLLTLAPNLFNELVQKLGMQPDPEVQHNATIEGIKKVGEAADAAGKLEEPAVPPVESAGQGSIRRTAADRA